MLNKRVHDKHIGRCIKRIHFEYNNNSYCKNINLINNQEFYTTRVTSKRWKPVQTTIELELAFETRKSRRLWWRLLSYLYYYIII
jgi:hypothetical protein